MSEMTREEAIAILETAREQYANNCIKEAFDTAIEAIQKVQRLEYLVNTHKQKVHSPHYSVTMEDLSYLLDMKEEDKDD